MSLDSQDILGIKEISKKCLVKVSCTCFMCPCINQGLEWAGVIVSLTPSQGDTQGADPVTLVTSLFVNMEDEGVSVPPYGRHFIPCDWSVMF